jgi:hypothetical protein
MFVVITYDDDDYDRSNINRIIGPFNSYSEAQNSNIYKTFKETRYKSIDIVEIEEDT